MKVTPAHDVTDFEIAKRHGLPIKPVISPGGKIDYPRPNAPIHLTKSYRYINGQPRFAAREVILRHLTSKNLYRYDIPSVCFKNRTYGRLII